MVAGVTDNVSNTPADYLGTLFGWLGQIALDPTDARFGLVFRVAGPCPPLDELRAMVAAHVERLPQLTERLVATTSVYWEPDPDFDIANHVTALPRGAGVLSAQALVADTLDPARPPWGIWISADDESWRLYYVVHHARQDAAAAVRTVSTLLGDGVPALAADRTPPSGRGWPAVDPIHDDVVQGKNTARSTPPTQYGPKRSLGTRAVEVALLKEISARTGATVNQVHLAAMSDALDRWTPLPDAERRPVSVPVDTRGAHDVDDHFANQIGLMRVALPCGTSTPADRLRDVMAAAGRDRLARYRQVWAGLDRAADNEVANWALQQITDPTQVSMTMSTLRVAAPMTVLSAPVLDVTAIPWLPPAHACFAFLISYGDQARLSVLTPEGVPDPDELTALWSDALQELRTS
jgi:diacylglycerol O-acyltransferase